MRRISMVATALAVAAMCVAGVSAQGKADFSGTWTLVPDPNAAPPGGGAPGAGGGRGGGRRGDGGGAAAAPGGAPGGGAPGAGGGRGGGGRGGRGGRGGGGAQFCGQECTITQDGTTLTVTRTTQAGEQKAMYKLDGSESKNTQQGRGGQATEIVSKAMWDGNKVSIDTTRPGRDGGPGITTKTVLSVTGGQLEVENVTDAGSTKQTYKKN